MSDTTFWLVAIGVPVVLVGGALFLLKVGPPILRRPGVGVGIQVVLAASFLVKGVHGFVSGSESLALSIVDLVVALSYAVALLLNLRAQRQGKLP